MEYSFGAWVIYSSESYITRSYSTKSYITESYGSRRLLLVSKADKNKGKGREKDYLAFLLDMNLWRVFTSKQSKKLNYSQFWFKKHFAAQRNLKHERKKLNGKQDCYAEFRSAHPLKFDVYKIRCFSRRWGNSDHISKHLFYRTFDYTIFFVRTLRV